MRRALIVAVLCALLVPLAALADDEDPVITVPANMTVEAQNFTGATVTYTASAVDHRGRPIPVTCSPASGGIFGFGRTRVTCTATDSEGRTATKRFDVTVVDTTPPALTLPASKRVSTTKRTGARVNYSATALDVVDGAVPVNCYPVPGALFPVGKTTVNCNARDARGNGVAGTFAVTVVLVQPRTARTAALLAPTPGARVTAPPVLRWRAVRKARFYNVQLFRNGNKILSAWPARSRLHLHARWTYNGNSYRLKPARYTWLVWPAFGPPTQPRFGKLLGLSSFVVAKA